MAQAFSGRREDARLVTGQGRYTSDWSLPGAARAVFLRSDIAHARIVSIDTAEALAAPGVVAVLTGADMAAAGIRRNMGQIPVKGRDGALKVVEAPALPVDRVRHVGEPVALVVAETEAQALDAAELIVLDLDPLPVVSDPADALAEGAVDLHDAIPGNLCLTIDLGDAAAAEAAFAGAAQVVAVDLESARVIGNPMEPKAALVRVEDGVIDLWCPNQGPLQIQTLLARAMGRDPVTIRVHAQDVGGAFGVRGDAYPEYAVLAAAAERLGRPVKWIGTRSETFVSDYHGRGVRMRAELALDVGGRFLGIRHRWLADLGAFPSAAGPLTSVMNAGLMACGAYRIPAIHVELREVVTNRVPVTAYRGAGRPDMAYAVERLVDAAARATGIDRIELRRRNMIPADAFPYPIHTAIFPAEYDSGDFGRLIDRALAESDWAEFAARRAEAAARGRLRGIGCALFIEPAGGVSPTDEAAITFDDEGRIVIHQVAQASGQGFETVYPEVVGRVLGIAPERIALAPARVDGPARKGGGAFGSRSMMSQGSVMDEAARQMLAKARDLAAEVLGADAAGLDYEDGRFGVPASNRFIGIEELGRRFPERLETRAELPSPRSFPSGMHVAEVEIDPETGAAELVAYVSVDDCGTVVNETLVRGQIWGGLLQGLGQVFGEIASYDAEAQLLAGTFMDYAMPRADLVRRVKIVTDQGVPSPGNRLGAKGVGEAGTVGSLPTAMNAVADALAAIGAMAPDMPASRHRIWEAIRAAANRPPP